MVDHFISYLAAMIAGIWSGPLLAMLLFSWTTPRETRGYTYRYVGLWGAFLIALVSGTAWYTGVPNVLPLMLSFGVSATIVTWMNKVVFSPAP